MKLTNAYIIDGDVIEKRIAELEVLNNTPSSNGKYSEAIQELVALSQHLKPALPIVVKSWEAGCQYIEVSNFNKKYYEANIVSNLNDFLTKDF